MTLIRCAVWLLSVTGALGAWMAVLRFGLDRAPARILLHLHGVLASAGLAVLCYGWATSPWSRLAGLASLLLLVAALGGASLRRIARWRQSPSIETLVFAHLCLAATGYLLLLAASLATT